MSDLVTLATQHNAINLDVQRLMAALMSESAARLGGFALAPSDFGLNSTGWAWPEYLDGRSNLDAAGEKHTCSIYM